MTVRMYEGCWGKTREGEIKGPYTEKHNPEHKKCRWYAPDDGHFEAVTKEGKFYNRGDEEHDDDIIKVYPSDPQVTPTDPDIVMVPVHRRYIPEGYRAVEVRGPRPGDLTLNVDGAVFAHVGGHDISRLILEKLPDPKPITLPEWVPEGWWVATDEDGVLNLFMNAPFISDNGEGKGIGFWNSTTGKIHVTCKSTTFSPEYLALPWDKSCIQKVTSLCEERK